MPKILKFHCNDCGGENLTFYANAKWTGVTFELRDVETKSAYCKDCLGLTPIFKSEEIIFGDEKPASNYNPMNQKGNL